MGCLSELQSFSPRSAVTIPRQAMASRDMNDQADNLDDTQFSSGTSSDSMGWVDEQISCACCALCIHVHALLSLQVSSYVMLATKL